MANDGTATRMTIKVKEYPVQIIINTEANISIITYPIIKKLQLAMGLVDSSQIIAIDQQRKMIKGIVKKALLAIADARVPITLLVIDTLESNLLLKTNWMKRYDAKLSFRKKTLIFEAKGQKIIINLDYNQLRFTSSNYTSKEYKVNMMQIDET